MTAELDEKALAEARSTFAMENSLDRAIRAYLAASPLSAQVLRLTEENEALRKERDEAIRYGSANYMAAAERADAIETRAEAAEARIKALEEAGSSLSNVVFNLAQLSNPLTDDQKTSMFEWVDAWDAALKESAL